MSEKTFCGHCVKATLLANPKAFGDNSIQWVNLLEQGVPALCPSCGVVYTVAKVISNSPRVSSDVRNIAGAVCGLLFLFVGMNFLDDLLS
ncbi:hypothetical protein BH24ACI2_BH24ACI2_06690 [soil metagenome]|jgi:hypothetical protein|nr:hypothetical protein [Acidobacteriota bacterium]